MILQLSKRQKFAISTIVLILGILAIRLPFLQWRFRVITLGLISFIMSMWAIRDRDFSGIEWITLLALPTLFSLGTALIFPLLPAGFDSIYVWPISYDTGLILALGLKIVFLSLFAVGYYAILLTMNIYNVAAIRTIQLLRAAHSVGFVMALFTALSLYLVVASLRLSSFTNFVLITLVSLILVFPTLWSVNLEEGISPKVRDLSVFIGVSIGEIAWALSFWPLPSSVFALFLTALFYILVGISQYFLSERLFGTTVKEFTIVASIVFLLIVVTTSWTG